MISALPFLALAAAAPEAPPPGTLIGCAFFTEASTEARPAVLGLGIYVPSNRMKGPIPDSLIEDPNGLIGASGFDKVESGPGWIRFSGRNRLRLQDSGGGIFKAELDGVAREGSCQMGRFPDQAAAFAFFNAFIHGVNTPE